MSGTEARGNGPVLRARTVAVAALVAGLALTACARRSPPAPVVDRSGIYYTSPATSTAATVRGAAGTGPTATQPVALAPARSGRIESAPLDAPQKAAPDGTAPLQRAAVPSVGRDSSSPPATGSLADSRPGVTTVRKGETLYAVSRREKIPLRALIDANGLKPPYILRIGQELKLPAVKVYVVARGDTVYALSRRFDVGIHDVIRANALKAPGFGLHVGQRLVLPGTPSAPAPVTGVATSVPDVTTGPAAVSLTPDRLEATARPTAVESRSVQAAATTTSGPTVQEPPREITTASVVVPPKPPEAEIRNPNARPPQRAGRKFLWPIRGKVVSGFGSKGGGLYNDGINIAAESGAFVRAAENGIVAYAGNELRGYGNLLLIRHADGWISAYAHNGEFLVRRGQVVKRGQTIARVGNTGAVAQPQLHFELRRGRKAVDPIRHLS
ncbi:MAG: peptidoglycan DD-metalloendopeptidase family protein [Alphaproteobacteria bacterium]|nr:peptidoglycan DD-metalloendopeptidase family protein [Alphaproteobacteria bacterium]